MFKKYFLDDINESTKEDKVINKSTKQPQKISSNFEDELRKLYKIKSVIYTAFGIQIEFLKKPEQTDILNLLDSKVKFKDKSIFIEF